MDELKEGIDALAEKRKANTVASDGMTRDQLLKDYGDIIDKQREVIKAWEKCAEDLVEYAHEFVAHLSTWGKGYDRNDKQIKMAEDAIEVYNKLKETK